MCTAATYQSKDFYMGRTLDYEFSYGEEIIFTPRRFPFPLRHMGAMNVHHAMLGMAHTAEGYPLYYEAMNEQGLCAAGLNFTGSAVYRPPAAGKDNVAVFELIPWLLGQCGTAEDARALLRRMNLTCDAFSPALPPAGLHWLIADKERCLTVEQTADGLHVYDNPAGVLTNEPSFPMQLFNLNNYLHVSPQPPENHFSKRLPLSPYSRGMGGLGLPGDLSSQSRFVRAAFVLLNARSGEGEMESVSQFFHILDAVAQPRGCCVLEDGRCEMTLYSSCCSAEQGVYYYVTYENRRILAVDMKREDPDGAALIRYPLIRTPQILFQN